jgi:hypothetical protein
VTKERADLLIRQAIGGNGDAAAWIRTQVDVTDDPVLLVMATLLAREPDTRNVLDRAAGLASNREDRQLIDIARAHLAANTELVDALARDHLVDFPSSYLVAWLASGAPAGS